MLGMSYRRIAILCAGLSFFPHWSVSFVETVSYGGHARSGKKIEFPLPNSVL